MIYLWFWEMRSLTPNRSDYTKDFIFWLSCNKDKWTDVSSRAWEKDRHLRHHRQLVRALKIESFLLVSEKTSLKGGEIVNR